MKKSIFNYKYLALLAALFTPSLWAHGSGVALGDGKVSSSPRQGYLYSCMQRFNPEMGGARGVPWIRDGYWYPDEKLSVRGNVLWPNARFSITQEGDKRVIRTNALPFHTTGVYPVDRSDPVYPWDSNPNSIQAQDFTLNLAANPELAPYPHCVGGEVGILLSGVLLFSAFDAAGRDAVAHEAQDRCNGHPQRSGQYHYHGPSPCVKDEAGKAGKHSELVGYAFDGFGLYGEFGEGGKRLKTADLDECHGHSHEVLIDGVRSTRYHYHFTQDFPYSVSCYRGTPAFRGPIGGPPGGPPNGPINGPDGRRPPPPRN